MRRFTPLVAFLPCLFVAATVVAQEVSPSRGERSGRGDRSERHRRRDSGSFGRTRDGEGDGNYELRGFFGSGLNTEISLRLSGTDKAYWIRVGDRMKDKEKDIYVEKVDPVVGTAVIITGGVRYKLRLAGEIPASARQGMQALPETTTSAPVVSGSGTLTLSQPATTTTVITRSSGGSTIVTRTETRDSAGNPVVMVSTGSAGNNPPPPASGPEPAPTPAVQNNAPNDAPPPPAAQS